MDVSRFGVFGLAAFIILVMGIWTFLIGVAARNHPDNPLAQSVIHFWSAQ